jgi:NADPH:quinone reductase-like Zn-dependent oxidoreductase
MKAIVYHRYGPPDVLRIEDTEMPAPGDGEVLVKVRAASVNPLDSYLMRGRPHVARILFGLRRPKRNRPGVDVAGQIEAVGRNSMQFRPGDEVFGSCRGAFAEYVCASESALVRKPRNVTFEQAAAAPVAAYTALQGLRDRGRLRAGQKVLVNGAAGGVGTFAVQIAKWLGADVTGVCSARNVEMVRSIGADHVIDYARDDFTRSAQRYDLIFDLVANHSVSACRRVLNPTGIYVLAGALSGGPAGFLVFPLTALALSPFVSQKMRMFVARTNRNDLITVGELMEAGKLVPVIEKRRGLGEVPEAIRYLEGRHARGKVVVTVEHDGDA